MAIINCILGAKQDLETTNTQTAADIALGTISAFVNDYITELGSSFFYAKNGNVYALKFPNLKTVSAKNASDFYMSAAPVEYVFVPKAENVLNWANNTTINWSKIVELTHGASRNYGYETSLATGFGANLEYLSLSNFNFYRASTSASYSITQIPFKSMPKLRELYMPALTSVPEEAFYSCTALTYASIGSNISSIGGGAFRNCNILQFVDMHPMQNFAIAYQAFRDCHSVKFSRDTFENCTTIGSSAFIGCYEMEDFIAPQLTDYQVLESLFYGCSNLKEVDLGSSIIYVYNCAFAYCSQLSSFNSGFFENLINIGSSCFYGCAVSVVDLQKITAIGNNAFRSCPNLHTLKLSYISSINGLSFISDCSELRSIYIGLTSAANGCLTGNLNKSAMLATLPSDYTIYVLSSLYSLYYNTYLSYARDHLVSM